MERKCKFFILYTADKVICDTVQCDVLIDGKIVEDIAEVQSFLNSHQFVHIINNKNRETLLNAWNILKVRYYEKS